MYMCVCKTQHFDSLLHSHTDETYFLLKLKVKWVWNNMRVN